MPAQQGHAVPCTASPSGPGLRQDLPVLTDTLLPVLPLCPAALSVQQARPPRAPAPSQPGEWRVSPEARSAEGKEPDRRGGAAATVTAAPLPGRAQRSARPRRTPANNPEAASQSPWPQPGAGATGTGRGRGIGKAGPPLSQEKLPTGRGDSLGGRLRPRCEGEKLPAGRGPGAGAAARAAQQRSGCGRGLGARPERGRRGGQGRGEGRAAGSQAGPWRSGRAPAAQGRGPDRRLTLAAPPGCSTFCSTVMAPTRLPAAPRARRAAAAPCGSGWAGPRLGERSRRRRQRRRRGGRGSPSHRQAGGPPRRAAAMGAARISSDPAVTPSAAATAQRARSAQRAAGPTLGPARAAAARQRLLGGGTAPRTCPGRSPRPSPAPLAGRRRGRRCPAPFPPYLHRPPPSW